MDVHRRSLLRAGVALATATWGSIAKSETPAAGASNALPAVPLQPTETLDLWPKAAPGMPEHPPVETVIERSTDPLVSDRAMLGITRPRLVVFRPDRPNGAALLILPGGGYRHVVVDKEGYEMARWLIARGFTAFVLFYRLPGEGWAAGPSVALADAQRAMRLIRQRAAGFAVDPERVAVMGFSAGGHVCASLAARFAAQTYESIDAADALSAKPFCAASIYPVVSMQMGVAHAGSRAQLIGADASAAAEVEQSPDRHIPDDAPPHFLVHAEDDNIVPVENTLILRAALRAKRISTETHLFRNGGHGFGLRKSVGKPVESWPELWRAWAGSIGLA